MDYLPIFLELKNRRCLIVGGGEVALRKIRLLRETGAILVVVARELHAELQTLVKQGSIEHLATHYQAQHLKGMALVIAATDDEVVNRQVSRHAKELQIPVNVVDNPALCSFIFPAIIDRSPILMAVSSAGHAPVLARLLREKLESLISNNIGKLARLSGEFRSTVKKRLPSIGQRRSFWESIFNSNIADRIVNIDDHSALQLLEAELHRAEKTSHLKQGEVYLVGAGPGDPDLLTFRALRLMQQADVVLYDSLISKEILNLIRRDAERVFVGKRCDQHSMSQTEINQLMISHAQAGQRVCRLKGGDPFIFGRGGEELQALQKAGIPFQVVPGVTAAAGCGAYAGIPLTHRDFAQSVTFVTGHGKDQKDKLDWRALARKDQTIVFYMGVKNFPFISKSLRLHGMSPQMPVAVIENGTSTAQRVITGTLADLPSRLKPLKLCGPSLLIIGDVVSLHSELAWFDSDALKTGTITSTLGKSA